MKLNELPNQIISSITGDLLTLTNSSNLGKFYVAEELGDSTECFDSSIVWYYNSITKESIYISYEE